MTRLMLIRTRYDVEVTAWIEGHAEYGTGHGSNTGAAVEDLMQHINTYRLRENLRRSLEQVTA